jgi:hypothetical protein
MSTITFEYVYVYDVILVGGKWEITGPFDGSEVKTGTLVDVSKDGIFTKDESVDIFDANGDLVDDDPYQGRLETDSGIAVILRDQGGSSPTFKVYSNVQLGAGPYELDEEPFTFCLLSGTLILTPKGERPVEEIRLGDDVLTHDGEIVKVRWVGRQSLFSFHRGDALPVVISAGALADNVPSRDLHVSPDHAILWDGCLVQAQALVNGTTVAIMENAPERLDYYHLELDRQRLIVADGAPVESFVDNVSRAGFDNFDEWVALGLEPQPAEALPYPRVKSARQLRSVQLV